MAGINPNASPTRVYPLLAKEGLAAPTIWACCRRFGAAGGGEFYVKFSLTPRPYLWRCKVALHRLFATDIPSFERRGLLIRLTRTHTATQFLTVYRHTKPYSGS